jgi:carbon monoxide dehydrogenase subunit G
VRIEVSRYVFAPARIVWSVLTDWEGQADWMVDAEDVEVVSEHREGVGVRLRCPTDLLGVTVEDEMVVTAYEVERRLEVTHTGRLIAGTGEFALEPDEIGTRIVWREELDPPLGPVGDVGARLVVAPYVRRVFGLSLDRLKERCEKEARRERLADVREHGAGGGRDVGDDVG